MTEGQEECLKALFNYSSPDGRMCLPFAPIMEETGLDRATVRRNVRALKRKGLAEFYKGLVCEDDGTLAGAGYCITQEGFSLMQKKYECPSCQGRGIVLAPLGTMYSQCEDCKGTGQGQ